MQVLFLCDEGASHRWASALAPALSEFEINAEVMALPLQRPRRPLGLIRASRLRQSATQSLRCGRFDAVILGPGSSLLLRPALVRRLLRVAEHSGTAVLVRWGDCAWIIHQVLAKASPRLTRRSVDLLRRPWITHLAMTRFEAAGVEALLSRRVTHLGGNVRPKTDSAPLEGPPRVPEDPPIVLNVASVQARKGTDIFIDVAERVQRERADVRFVWVGGVGPDPEWARHQIDGSGTSVEFVGHQNDPLQWIQRASIILITSRSEAASGAVLEAMSAARCVVAFDSTGTPELLGGTGIVVSHSDAEAATTAVMSVIQRPARERLSLQARSRFIEEFTPAPAARRLSKAIADAVVQYKLHTS